MKALLIADVESKALWDYYTPERLEGVDLIIACGDLKRQYLEFLVTMGSRPLLYVPGNHDGRYQSQPPEGCENIDDAVYVYHGVRFLGLGGSQRYNTESPYQYTEKEMEKRIRSLRRQIKKAGGVDVVVTHAAPAGLGDQEDLAHRGFDCFKGLMEEYNPPFFVHGHVHMNYGNIPRLMQFGQTQVVNAYERYMLELPEGRPGLREGFLEHRRRKTAVITR
ncbi:MAG: metallophosphoesterase family protein [Clostridia bacterium]|nr:metallophosphoesterase family protein [Clostridia bacterium]